MWLGTLALRRGHPARGLRRARGTYGDFGSVERPSHVRSRPEPVSASVVCAVLSGREAFPGSQRNSPQFLVHQRTSGVPPYKPPSSQQRTRKPCHPVDPVGFFPCAPCSFCRPREWHELWGQPLPQTDLLPDGDPQRAGRTEGWWTDGLQTVDLLVNSTILCFHPCQNQSQGQDRGLGLGGAGPPSHKVDS